MNRVISPAFALALLGTAHPAIAKDRQRLTIDIEALLTEASGETSDGFEDQDRSGYMVGGDAEIDVRRGKSDFTVGVGSHYFRYTDDDRDDRWNNSAWLGYGLALSDKIDWSTEARYDSAISTLERREAAQTRLRSGIAYSDGPHRFRVRGGYRWREYDDQDDTNGKGWETGVDYRYRFENDASVLGYLRYDEIDADIISRDYRRWSLGANVAVPVSERVEILPSLRYRWWRYPNRLTDDDKIRKDNSITPGLGVRFEVIDDLDLELSGQIIFRESNDDQYDETIKRFTIGISKRFRTDL